MDKNIIPFRRKKRLDWLEGVTPRKFPVTAVVGLAMGIGMALVAIFLPPSQMLNLIPALAPTPPQGTKQFSLCFTGGGTNCVVDGDTFWYHGEDIRIADIDAPETHPPRCAREAELGRKATLRLQELLNQGPISLTMADKDHDQYGRKLRIVMRDYRSLGAQLVNEGLARRWAGARQPWCRG